MHMPVDSALTVAAASRAVQSLLVAMERWSCGHRSFSVESFFKNNDSATQTQREFRKHLSIRRNDKVPMHQTILNLVGQFRSTASALPEKKPGHPRSVCNPENMEREQVALQQSPLRSARRHSVALGMLRECYIWICTFIHSKFK
jgi:hypothetical protein